MAIGRELYVRFNNGDGMRRVYNVDDFNNGVRNAARRLTLTGAYCCDVYGCDAVLCEYCGGSMTGDYYCPRHRGNELLTDAKEPAYVYPYAFECGSQFTFGVEIESELSDDFAENVTNSDIIAGWDKDASLERNGVELPALQRIRAFKSMAITLAGHIHVARTPNQCASRWFWALHGLDAAQCRRLNMRHIDDDYWCTLTHGEYTGKHTAINDEHADTIELRDCWCEGTADKLVPAVKWIRAMWRFFEKHPRGTVSASLIEKYAACMADNVTDTPVVRSPNDSLPHVALRRHVKLLRRAAKIRRNVEANVRASRTARCSHGETLFATLEYRRHEKRRERGRELVEGRLSAPELCYTLPSRNLRPLHHYVQAATVMIMAGDRAPVFDSFHLYHAYSGANIWNGICTVMAMRVVENVVRSRVARASHGKPTVETLERTALRLYKRAAN